MNKKKKIIIAICCLFAALLGAWGGFFVVKMNKKTESHYTLYETEYDNIKIKENQNIIVATKDKRDVVLDLENKIVDPNNEDGSVVALYNDYYMIITDTEKILKRNGNEISRDTNDLSKMYKDENDLDSEYICFGYDYNNLVNSNNIKIIKNGKEYSLYNSKNGEIIVSDVKKISQFINNDEKIGLVIEYDKHFGILLFETETIYSLEDGYEIVSDTNNIYTTNNSKYVIIKDENNRHGVASINGEVIIKPEYTDLYFTGEKTDYLVAVKSSNYGLIDITNKEILPFKYIGIEIADKNVITIAKDSIAVKDEELKNIVELKETISYTPRKEALKYSIVDEVLIIQLESTYLIKDNKLFGTIEGNTTIIENDITNEKYIIAETIKSNVFNVDIYNLNNEIISKYDKREVDNVSQLSYQSLEKNRLRINIYDKNVKVLDSIIYDIENQTSIASDFENDYGAITRLNDRYYIKEKDNIVIYNSGFKEVRKIPGKSIYHINENTYVIINNNNKYQLVYFEK